MGAEKSGECTCCKWKVCYFKCKISENVISINGQNATLGTYVGAKNQMFDIKYMGAGYYQILSVQSGKSLDVANASSEPGANLWEYSWMKEWLDTYNTDPERAEKALEELEKAFDMPYMGIDRCDDATRNYLRENIDKAKLGDPSGFTESIRANYAN